MAVPFSAEKPLTEIRAVHLDLKGLPPTPERLLTLLDLFRHLRFNAVLVEWEDMFPWTVDPRFRSPYAYNRGEVDSFLARAKALGIEVIPLVQCLGHLETFLRPQEYAALREVPHLCDVLNPLAEGAREFVERLIDDVLAVMPDVKRFHLGGDEAWTFGQHPQTRAYIERHGKGALYLHHVEPLLRKLGDRGIRPILWHDMMVEWDDASLKRLASQADLCVWGYGETPDETTHHYATKHIERFHANGVRMWGATAYKGADGHNVDLPDLRKRQHNALGWADVARRFPFAGLIATAWSRYNTNLQQCEPIDGALDALAAAGVILHDGMVPDGGGPACVSLLADGDRAIFERVKLHLRNLADARRAAWAAIQDVRERVALLQKEPGRGGSDQQVKRYRELRAAVETLKSAGSDVATALAGLVPKASVDTYLYERIEPVVEEAREIGTMLGRLGLLQGEPA